MRFFSCRLRMWVGKQLQTNFLWAIGFFSCRLRTWAGKQLQTNFLQAIGFFSCRLCMWVGKQLQTNYLWAMGLFSCRSSIQLTLQSPILGYLWGYPIPGISEPWRYPILEWYDLHTYHTIPYHSTSYHTIPPHTIPYHVIPYHHSKPVTGCLGSFLQNIKNIPAGCNTDPLGSIFCGLVV